VTRPALYEWVVPAGWPHPPPALDRAQAEFDAAMAAHARGDAGEAATRFEAAARLVPEDERYAAALAGMREIARRNAALVRDSDAHRPVDA
jgi:hypothetical protein